MTGKYIMRFGVNTDRTLLFNALKRLDMANYAGGKGWGSPNQFDDFVMKFVDKIIKTGNIEYGETSEGRLSGYEAALEVKREYAREVVKTAAEQWRLELTEDPGDETGLTFFASIRGE